jgi:hypothetical protein
MTEDPYFWDLKQDKREWYALKGSTDRNVKFCQFTVKMFLGTLHVENPTCLKVLLTKLNRIRKIMIITLLFLEWFSFLFDSFD